MERILPSKGFVLWNTVLITLWINSNTGQRLNDVASSCVRPDEMDFLKKDLKVWQTMVKEQAIKIEILEEKLNSVHQKLSFCCSSKDSSTATINILNPAVTAETIQIPTKHLPIPTTNLTSTFDEPAITTREIAQTTQTQSTTTQKGTSTEEPSKESISDARDGSRGREFLILFMGNHPSVLQYDANVYISTDNEAIVDVLTSSNLNTSIKASVDKKTTFRSNLKLIVPHQMVCGYFTIEPKALILRTSEISTVTIFDSIYHYTSDGTLIIPTDSLSNEYLISSTEPLSSSPRFNSQIAIGALLNSSIITIKLKIKNNYPITILGGTYRDGDIFSFTLDKFETLQIRHFTDLTGTFINSTKPIAVFSGNRCNRFIENTGSCSHMVTQLPPTTAFDKKYIIPPFIGNAGTLIQVVSENQNCVNATIGSNTSIWSLNEREHINLMVDSNETTILASDKPFLVTGAGIGSNKNDPYMTVIPGVDQYVNYYNIIVPDGYAENYLCVIMSADISKYLRINGNNAEYYETVYQTSVELEQTFNVHTLIIRNGTFVLSTADNYTFGVIIYGHRVYDGYAFSGNFVST